MNNYKIKVKDEAESKEVQELFFRLGAKRPDGTTNLYHSPSVFGLLVVEGLLNYVFADVVFRDSGAKELTLPQLRDLIVLKRNDVKDATHTCENNFKYICIENRWYLMTTDGWFQVSVNPKALKPIQTVEAVLNNLDELREEYKDYHQDQGLISGAEAMIAALDDQEVEYRWVDGSCNWRPFNDEDWSVEDLKSGTYSFRLKPQTIKLELEIPAPYKAKIGGRDDTSFVLNVGRHQYLYQNEDDYTKARNALEAVFDAALGGNNS
ncbi:TPA: hypothetical protein NU643_000733 [Acinetobacter baumannii]|uniref:hypothetical protein n=1 Tax=Acinetobacter baumannii TaxID=470 RepID=UPI000993D692|nr:hypothetical protein [Acinetobacter baumannii]EKX0166002.1 hypothetical protein [Acinetobacter baumannii]ELT5726956.1 hypothetical protein [Acinetobacter baumannii]MDR8122566.1 hypothetical protein [Acinetobacter baumannii]MDR8160306.1 hypothetical protein [Acinetobacter baumannii]OOS42593.1 hypothetical protein BTG55_01420 [Acinetobacter baumannii]